MRIKPWDWLHYVSCIIHNRGLQWIYKEGKHGYAAKIHNESTKTATTKPRLISNVCPLPGFDERQWGKTNTPIVSECYQAKEARNTTIGSISSRIRIINFLDHSAKQTSKVEDVLQGYAHARKHDKECFSLSRPYLKQQTYRRSEAMNVCCTLAPLELVKIDRWPLRNFPFSWPSSLLTRHKPSSQIQRPILQGCWDQSVKAKGIKLASHHIPQKAELTTIK